MRCSICNSPVKAGMDICNACDGVVKNVYLKSMEDSVELSVIPKTAFHNSTGGRILPIKGQD